MTFSPSPIDGPMASNLTQHLKVSAVALLTVLISACGGSSGSDSSGDGNVDGKLVAEIRTSGYSSAYRSDATYKDLVDLYTGSLAELADEANTLIRWDSDIPAVFSGCGFQNAFFGMNVDVHAELLQNSVADPTAVFGPNVTGNVLVMCHELSELILDGFLNNADIIEDVNTYFQPADSDELSQAVLFSALVMEAQVFLHEVGHAMDFLLIKDSVSNATKQLNYTIPLANQCGSAGCDTISEDFADWIASYLLIEDLQSEIATDPTSANSYTAAWLVATSAWDRILGAGGGDLVHGLTQARQINFLCYAYGGLPELRALDATQYGSGLANVLTAQGLDPADCESIYLSNETANNTLLSSYLK